MLVLHLVVLEMGFADRELHPLIGSGGVPGIEIIKLYKDDEMMEVGTVGAQMVQPWKQLTVQVSSNQDHGLPLDVIASGDTPCLKRAGLPCGGGGGPTIESINFG
ncbi:hypothetical protein Bca4012_050661 [Brassica carinata]